MRTLQMTFGLIVVVVGVLMLLAVNGVLAFTALDVTAIALILSGLFFWVPGLVWRRTIPWLTSLFIPGSLAFCAGAIVLYTSRVGWNDVWYLSTALLIALGIAFIAMYYLGPRERWLWLVGLIVATFGLFFLALFLALFGSVTGARVVGSILLIGIGLAFAFGSLVPRRVRGA
ncbi:MAG: hypothetical protein HY782_18700 [Chloroflexi bacterium]|nr:hypothetical protein [Chloroflexota bacterium]